MASPRQKSKSRSLKRKPAQDSNVDDHSSEEANAVDSDTLDVDVPVKKSRTSKVASKKPPQKKRRKKAGSVDEDSESELEEGQQIVGTVIRAPTTGRVPPGQISQNTFDFLSKLRNPDHNDREWFKLHEPVYRQAEKEWNGFIEKLTDIMVEVDPQIPHLPPKDVIHRIYRDIRFSNNKTPYKTNMSASFSRSGRKGIFAGYHVKTWKWEYACSGHLVPWEKRITDIKASNNIQRSPKRLRRIISSPDFVKCFGKAEPGKNGARSNIFGREDELKTAPKGVPKTHPDIDLLKCRSFTVAYMFNDTEVLTPDFKDKLKEMIQVVQPFVHCLNDMMTLPDAGGDSSNEEPDD